MHTPRPRPSIATGFCLLVVVAGCGSDAPVTDDGDAPTVPVAVVTAEASTDPSTGSSPVSDSTVPTTVATNTTAPASGGDTTTSNSATAGAPKSKIDDPIASAVAVAATPNGVVVDQGRNTWDAVVIDDTTLGTPRLVDGFVVYQGTDGGRPDFSAGPILVSDGMKTREFADGGRDLVLLDVGHVEGARAILASSRAPMPVNPDQADDRLLLIDTDSFEVTDLGEFGGWESSVTSARFGDDAISLTLTVNTSSTLEVIEFDGTIRHSIELPADRGWNLVDFDGSVWALDASFRERDVDESTGIDLIEFLDIRQVDLTDGSVRESTIDVDLSGLGERAADGYCAHADYFDGWVLCDQTVGAPFTFPIEGDAAATLVSGLSDGTAMFRASQ